MVLENCEPCFNYWMSRGRYPEGYYLLIRDQHIPEAHASHPNPAPSRPSGPSVSDLQNQLSNANSRANGLQSQLDAANSRNSSLQTQLNNANSQISSLQTQLVAANNRANDLQRQLDDCKREKKKLEDEVTQLKTDKVNLENVNKKLEADGKKKDSDIKTYQKGKLDAENKIAIKLEPYIKRLQKILDDNNIKYPSGP